MKILAIRGCNLASLAGEFEIDLARGPLGVAGVFAIVGPTGAGKSTLLDAMCVALFDRTPRLPGHSRVTVGHGEEDPLALGALDPRTLLRRGASQGWAEVDFESGDTRRYRARWSVRRARDATDGNLQDQQVTLTAIDAHSVITERLGGTKTETLKAIHQRLGLTFDQFRRSALLAQGDFAAFLRADGRDRSELLERMTGTEIYSKLSIAAHERAVQAEQALRERQAAALAIFVLDDDTRTRTLGEAEAAKLAREAARHRLADAEKLAQWRTEAIVRATSLAQAESEHQLAEAEARGAEPLRSELVLRRRAEALRGVWDEASRLDREHSIAQGELAGAVAAAAAAERAKSEIVATHARISELHTTIREARMAAAVIEAPKRLARGTIVPGVVAEAEQRAHTALEPAAWLVARRELAPLILAWPELEAKLVQDRTLLDGIAAADRVLTDQAAQRTVLVEKAATVQAASELARHKLQEASREAESFVKRRTLGLDAASRAEDAARTHCGDVDRLVTISHGSRGAANVLAELGTRLNDLEVEAASDRERRKLTEHAGAAAAVLRDERARVAAELRNAAGYEHARAELVEGEPCPLCGAADHPWKHKGAFDALIADAERTLLEATTQWDASTKLIAQLDARELQREAERTRFASTRATAQTSAESLARDWSAQLAALGELSLVTDPASSDAEHLASERAESARSRLEAARATRSAAEAAHKAVAEAQARVQVCQANLDHHLAELRELAAALAAISVAIERLTAERAARIDRHAELVRDLAAIAARWYSALPVEDRVHLGMEMVVVAERANNRARRAGEAADSSRGASDGGGPANDAVEVERPFEPASNGERVEATEVAGTNQRSNDGPRGRATSDSSRGASDGAGSTISNSSRGADEGAGSTISNSSRASDRGGPANDAVEVERPFEPVVSDASNGERVEATEVAGTNQRSNDGGSDGASANSDSSRGASGGAGSTISNSSRGASGGPRGHGAGGANEGAGSTISNSSRGASDGPRGHGAGGANDGAGSTISNSSRGASDGGGPANNAVEVERPFEPVVSDASDGERVEATEVAGTNQRSNDGASDGASANSDSSRGASDGAGSSISNSSRGASGGAGSTISNSSRGASDGPRGHGAGGANEGAGSSISNSSRGASDGAGSSISNSSRGASDGPRGASDSSRGASDGRGHGARGANDGPHAFGAVLIDRARFADLVQAWRERAAAVTYAEASLAEALAEIDRASLGAERAVAETAARHSECAKRSRQLAAELVAASTALDAARITAGFEREALHRVLADDASRVDVLATELERLDRAVDRARTRIAERSRLVLDHDGLRPVPRHVREEDGERHRRALDQQPPRALGHDQHEDHPLDQQPGRALGHDRPQGHENHALDRQGQGRALAHDQDLRPQDERRQSADMLQLAHDQEPQPQDGSSYVKLLQLADDQEPRPQDGSSYVKLQLADDQEPRPQSGRQSYVKLLQLAHDQDLQPENERRSSDDQDPTNELAARLVADADADRLPELAAAVKHADHHAAALAATLAADDDARKRREEALAAFAAAERAAEVDRVLGDVIGSHDGKLFRSFAQSLTLDHLLAVANSHLEELAPRYQLERVPKHDLELQVIDRDFGGEVRSVQSLSGGESFLVSLALALGLSSMSAHDVRVRTLLIDEGFGTLDPATLDSALAVLDELQATGRQVGIISHVPALLDRVRAHVRVTPRGGGRSDVQIPPS